MSTADSQLLCASSAFASDVYKPVIRKNKTTDKEMFWAGRIVVLIIAVIAVLIASNPGSGSIMDLVENAWGIFGAAFGPAILLSLFWKRFTFKGAVAGIFVGAAVDICWLAFIGLGIYEIIPGFVAGLIAAVVVFLILIVGIVFVDLGERRIPIQYAKRMVGRRMYGGQSTHIPLKLNASGVLPLIFANAIMQFPATILAFFPNSAANQWWTTHVSSTHLLYQVIFALMIFGFTFFYSEISFNPVEIAKNIQNNGGMIPGIRQGKPTSDYIKKISHRITMFGAIYLAVLAVIPMVIYAIAGVSLPFAASSLLIAVSVAMETMRELESQMLMRHYKGFLN